jgi:hypothetical protein
MSTDSLDVLGYRWVPEHPEQRVPGQLNWEVQDGGRLELPGELRPFELKDDVLGDGSVQKY